MRKIKTAVIGCGAISGIYLENLKNKFSVIDLVGCHDHGEAKCRAVAERYGIRALTLDELLRDESIEMVVNLTPPKAHYTVTKQLLEAGKNVYSEKVLAVNVEEAKDLVRIADEKGLYLGAAPDTFLGSALQTARQAVERGLIGKVTSCFAQDNRDYRMMGQIVKFIPQAGGGMGFDLGIYYITALLSLLGPVKKVNGFLAYTEEKGRFELPGEKRFGEQYDIESETILAGTLEFSNGVIGSVQFNSECIFPEQPVFMLCGTEGVLYLSDPNCFGGTVYYRAKGSAEKTVLPCTFGYSENSRGLGVAEMAWSILAGRSNRACKEMACHGLEVLHGIAESSKTDRTCYLTTSFDLPQPLKSGFLPDYLGADHLIVEEEASLV